MVMKHILMIFIFIFFVKHTYTQYKHILNFDTLLKHDYDIIKQTFHKFKETFIKQDVTPNNFLTNIYQHHDNIICKSCLFTYNSIHKFLSKKYGFKVLLEIITLLCSIGLDHEVCKGTINVYAPVLYDSLLDHYLTGNYICTLLHVCKNEHFIKLNADDYAKNLLSDKPSKTRPDIDPTSPTWKVLQLADLHTDLRYVEGSRGLCPQELCCREESINGFTGDRAGKFGYLGKCDIPVVTLESFVDTTVNIIKPDFIIWTGDNAPHDPWTGDQEAVYKVTELFVNMLVNKYNYSLPVYPSIGNHEEYPNDLYYPYDNREQNKLKIIGDIFKVWLEDQAYESFIKYGYYSQKHPNSNLRIVSTNCLLCDTVNFNLIRNPTDPQSGIKWLEDTLKKAEQDNELVYLIGHIPIGEGFFSSECSKRYIALMDRYNYIIRGNFYGHTHNDEFKVMTEYFNKEKVIDIQYIAPSLTTYTFLNPSFRVYEIDSNTKLIKDYIQYRLDIEEANSRPDEKPLWDIAYRATSLYNVANLAEIEKISQIAYNLENDKDNFLRILNVFYTNGPLFETMSKKKNISKYLKCRFTEPIFLNYMKCIDYKSWDFSEYTLSLLNILQGDWFENLPEN